METVVKGCATCPILFLFPELIFFGTLKKKKVHAKKFFFFFFIILVCDDTYTIFTMWSREIPYQNHN